MTARARHWRAVCLLLAFGFLFPPGTGTAQDVFPPVPFLDRVRDWNPLQFELECGPMLGPNERPDPGDFSCLDPNERISMEWYLGFAARDFKNRNYWSPDGLGPVIESFHVDDLKVVRVYASPNSEPAFVWLRECKDSAPDMMVGVNPAKIAGKPDHHLAWIMAHEMHHTVVNGGPALVLHNCVMPEWISEGMADAIGIDFAKSMFPSSFPDLGEARRRIAGLRAYYMPLNFDFEPLEAVRDHGYKTSSFWAYLARRFHGNDYFYMQRYLGSAPESDGSGGFKWVEWLGDKLWHDAKVGSPLYIIYPAFVTDFAGQWADGGIADHFDRSEWMLKAFSRCEEVTVSQQEPYAELEVKILPLAARCLSVKVSGLGESDHLAAVKVGVLTDDADLADSLHLGLAFKNDSTAFNCAQATRAGRLPEGLKGCLIEPVTGVFETGVQSRSAARMWHASSIEKGQGGQSNAYEGQVLENVYIISYLPTDVTDAWVDNNMELQVLTLAVGLDVTTLAIDGKSVNSGSTGGKRTRATGSMRLRPSETDRVDPATHGYKDLGAAEQILPLDIANMAKAGDWMGGQAQAGFPGFLDNGFVLFRLAESEVMPAEIDVPLQAERIEIIREFTVLVEQPLEPGETGSFDAFIVGQHRRNPMISYFSPKDEPASVVVEENSYGSFRANVSGIVCEFDVMSGIDPKERCPRRVQVSAKFIKPFNFLYDPGNPLISRETEGEKLYNRFHTVRLDAALAGTDADAGGSAQGGGGSGSGGEGSTGSGSVSPMGCECACPDVVVPDSDACRTQCVLQHVLCAVPPNALAATESPAAPEESLAEQRNQFSRLIEAQGLPASTEAMLIEDFATMSPETRAYLIQRYGGNVQ